MEFPVSQIREMPSDWTLRFKGREWQFQAFWIMCHSGTARTLPRSEDGRFLLDLSEPFADFDSRTFQWFHDALYFCLELRDDADPHQIRDLWTLCDFMDSLHLLNPGKRRKMSHIMERAFSLESNIEYAEKYGFQELGESCCKELMWTFERMEEKDVRLCLKEKRDEILAIYHLVPKRNATPFIWYRSANTG
jgi:hypothetical protein